MTLYSHILSTLTQRAGMAADSPEAVQRVEFIRAALHRQTRLLITNLHGCSVMQCGVPHHIRWTRIKKRKGVKLISKSDEI